jgi:peptidoglycan hydrolase-like protein with peptidoglycan-binding domain
MGSAPHGPATVPLPSVGRAPATGPRTFTSSRGQDMYQARHAVASGCDHGDTAEPARRGTDRRTLMRAAGGIVLGGGVIATTASAAQAATSQNGWPAGSSSQIPLVGLTVDGVRFPAGVRSGDVGAVLGYVARRVDAEVESLVAGWCWGHAYRPVRGGTTLSNHSSGTAIDINAPRHPIGSSNTFSATQQARIRAILADCDGVIRWGGDYSSRKDDMHFEINVRPGDARLSALARRVGGGGGGGTPSPSPPWSTVRRGATGFRVVAIQHLLRHRGLSLTVDGVFGAATAERVVAFQRRQALAADGIVGDRTWSALVALVRQGSRGEAVVGLQRTLGAHRLVTSADGIFGAGTAARVRDFQRSRRLTADGIVGSQTWSALTR